MGLVQQGWLVKVAARCRPRFYWQPWDRLLWEASVGAASRRDSVSIAPRWRSHVALRFQSVPLALSRVWR